MGSTTASVKEVTSSSVTDSDEEWEAASTSPSNKGLRSIVERVGSRRWGTPAAGAWELRQRRRWTGRREPRQLVPCKQEECGANNESHWPLRLMYTDYRSEGAAHHAGRRTLLGMVTTITNSHAQRAVTIVRPGLS